jgi:hypothetical protein
MLTYADVCALQGGGAQNPQGTQFTYVTGTKVQILTQKALQGGGAQNPQGRQAAPPETRRRYSVYLLNWYKSTNTDAAGACRSAACRGADGVSQRVRQGAPFTCFTSTKVKIRHAKNQALLKKAAEACELAFSKSDADVC